MRSFAGYSIYTFAWVVDELTYERGAIGVDTQHAQLVAFVGNYLFDVPNPESAKGFRIVGVRPITAEEARKHHDAALDDVLEARTIDQANEALKLYAITYPDEAAKVQRRLDNREV